MIKNIIKLSIISFFWILIAPTIQAITLTITPTTQNWSAVIPAIVGNDLADPTRNITMSVGGCVAGETWRISAHKSNINNPPEYQTVSVRRTGTGTGTGSAPSGGDSYLVLDTVDQQFFTGELNRSDIPINWIISKLSVTIEPSFTNYSMQIVFTVTSI